MPKAPEDLAAYPPFGRLTALSLEGRSRNREALWLCLCECGTYTVVQSGNLKSGATTSCGCFHREGLSKRVTTHGMSRSRVHRIWCSLKQRCTNPKIVHWDRYGGRGVKLYRPWHKFENFHAGVGDPPSDEHTLDRYPDKDGDYKPGNVRWATAAEQARNTSRTIELTWNKKTQCLTDWALELGIPVGTLFSRYYKNMPLARMMTAGRLHKTR